MNRLEFFRVLLTASAGTLLSKKPVRGAAPVTSASDPNGLYGISGVAVVVNPVDKKFSDVVTTEQLQTDAELKLRQSGIKVLDSADISKSVNAGVLIINALILKTDPDLYSFEVTISLAQWTQVYRVPAPSAPQMVFASTWEKSNVGYAGADKTDNVRKLADDYLDIFCNTYLAANPKK